MDFDETLEQGEVFCVSTYIRENTCSKVRDWLSGQESRYSTRFGLHISGPTDEVSLLTGLLKTAEPGQDSVVVRKGTTDDVYKSQAEPAEEPPTNKPPCLPDSSCYTQEEFEKEFGDTKSADDYDADPRRVANFDMIERNDVTVEEAAHTISSMDAFKSKSGLSFVVKVRDNFQRQVIIGRKLQVCFTAD